ncbi:unnamed protein product, partial [Phaeothamnion confervicola]
MATRRRKMTQDETKEEANSPTATKEATSIKPPQVRNIAAVGSFGWWRMFAPRKTSLNKMDSFANENGRLRIEERHASDVLFAPSVQMAEPVPTVGGVAVGDPRGPLLAYFMTFLEGHNVDPRQITSCVATSIVSRHMPLPTPGTTADLIACFLTELDSGRIAFAP